MNKKKDLTPNIIEWKPDECEGCKFDIPEKLTLPNCTYPEILLYDKKGKCEKRRNK